MSRVHSVILANPGPFVSTFLVVHYRDDGSDLEITSIEMYGDSDCATAALAELRIEDLPREAQESIFAALAAKADRRRRISGMNRLWSDLKTMQQESRL